MVQRRVLQCGLCRNKEKCLKPDLKCVNRWSISTVGSKSSRVLEQQQRNEAYWQVLSSVVPVVDYVVVSELGSAS